jgi:hypothetical protein
VEKQLPSSGEFQLKLVLATLLAPAQDRKAGPMSPLTLFEEGSSGAALLLSLLIFRMALTTSFFLIQYGSLTKESSPV